MTPPGPLGPSTDVLAVLAVVVGSMLVAIVGLTLGLSVHVTRRDRRADARRDRLRSALLERLYGEPPDWGAWVEGLSAADRRVVRDLLRDQLRWVRGTDRERLRSLAGELGLVERAHDLLEERARHRRLLGLTWLALLGERVDADRLVDRCRDHPETRGAGARLAVEVDGDARAVGERLLLGPGEALSVLGVDTLFHCYENDPEALARRASADGERWSESLFIQVLEVFGECAVVGPGAPLDWVLDRLDADSPRVRAAAVGALAAYGWRDDVRAAVVDGAVADDPDPEVRAVAYRVYGEWASDGALARLTDALRTDGSDRCRVTAARALRRAGWTAEGAGDGETGDAGGRPHGATDGRSGTGAAGDGPADSSPPGDPALAWVVADAEVGR
jgi:hypothetical protein